MGRHRFCGVAPCLLSCSSVRYEPDRGFGCPGGRLRVVDSEIATSSEEIKLFVAEGEGAVGVGLTG